jgi:glycine/D-amino acid oxidase-like deaminating enzyme
MSQTIDFLIIGQGLAGSILGYKLHKAGFKIKILDNNLKNSASKVAAGLIHPITGKRLALSWRIETLRPYSDVFYRELEKEFNEQFIHHKMSLRLFKSEEEAALCHDKNNDPEFKKFFHSIIPPETNNPHITNPFGGVLINHSAYVNTTLFLRTLKKYFEKENLIVSTKCEAKDLTITPKEVIWKSITSKRIIFCEGYKSAQNPFFSWIPWKSAKGEILTVDIPNMPKDRILQAQGHWLLPLKDGTFKFGSTYEWDTLDTLPTEKEKNHLTQALEKFSKHPFSTLDHQAGVRPILKDTKPVLGHHPQWNHVFIFNALSSKGVIQAPYFAEEFTQYFTNNKPIDPEVSIARFSIADKNFPT